MKKIILFVCSLTILSCSKINRNESYEGYLYITLINVYDVNSIMLDGNKDQFKKKVLSFSPEGKSKSDILMNDYYHTLIKHNLFDKPSFQVKFLNGEIINVYVNNDEYEKLKTSLNNFDRDKEKIKIEFDGVKISNGVYDRAIYSANTITSVKKSKGETEWSK